MMDSDSLKEEGNKLFRAGKYEQAALIYKYAINFDPSDPSLYSNRAAAYLKLGKLQKALTDADSAVVLNPDWEKGYYRQGCVLEAMGRYDEALDAFETAIECNPQSLEVLEKIKKLGLLAKDKQGEVVASLKDEGNSLFKAGNYLQAAAIYTEAIKLDPSNPTLYSNRSAAYFNLVKLRKALTDAEKTITLNPLWEKGYVRKGCVLEAMERYDEALSAFQIALQYNPKSLEVSKKIKNLGLLAKDKRGEEVENMWSNIDIPKHLNLLKSEMSEKYGAEDRWKDMFSFLVEISGTAIKSWHETSKVDPSVHFLLDKEKTQIDKYAPVVNIDKAFESPHSHSSCIQFLKQYAEDSFSHAACLVAPKNIISYPKIRKGKGSRKWKHGKSDGFFIQFETPSLQKMWFIPSSSEKGKILCRNPVALDVSAHELVPRLYK